MFCLLVYIVNAVARICKFLDSEMVLSAIFYEAKCTLRVNTSYKTHSKIVRHPKGE